jgi:hypothetical protein
MPDAQYTTIASPQNKPSKRRSPEFIMVLGMTGIAILVTVFLQVIFHGLTNAQDAGSGYTNPPVYPARIALMSEVTIAIGSGAGQWADAYVKAKMLVAQMTLVEKVRSIEI